MLAFNRYVLAISSRKAVSYYYRYTERAYVISMHMRNMQMPHGVRPFFPVKRIGFENKKIFGLIFEFFDKIFKPFRFYISGSTLFSKCQFYGCKIIFLYKV